MSTDPKATVPASTPDFTTLASAITSTAMPDPVKLADSIRAASGATTMPDFKTLARVTTGVMDMTKLAGGVASMADSIRAAGGVTSMADSIRASRATTMDMTKLAGGVASMADSIRASGATTMPDFKTLARVTTGVMDMTKLASAITAKPDVRTIASGATTMPDFTTLVTSPASTAWVQPAAWPADGASTAGDLDDTKLFIDLESLSVAEWRDLQRDVYGAIAYIGVLFGIAIRSREFELAFGVFGLLVFLVSIYWRLIPNAEN